ncbi:MAG TPA: tetratricopeptide repeat protein [Pirellulales bacterium]|jgi:tetratricopeptide (TPR) repeat protein|nr:tetratricopeptide repeat protein [Pirellulales bacterium]
MPAPIRPVDEHGFPIPTKFEDWPRGGEDEPRPPRRSISQRMGRWKWLFLLLVPGLLFGRQLVDFGRDLVAGFQMQRAWRDLQVGELRKAKAHIDRAIEWEPDAGARAADLSLRARVREKLQDLDGSLRDCDQAIALWNEVKTLRKASDDLPETYRQRAWVLQRLGRHREALADCKAALESCPRWSVNRDPTLYPNLLNERAYISALSGLEVEAGLQDIEQAIRELGDDKAELLDTRACLRYRLGQYDAALRDMQVAIRSVTARRSHFRLGWDADQVHAFSDDRDDSQITDQELAVMYRHEGEIYRKLSDDPRKTDRTHLRKLADADLEKAALHGFDPSGGESLEANEAKGPTVEAGKQSGQSTKDGTEPKTIGEL